MSKPFRPVALCSAPTRWVRVLIFVFVAAGSALSSAAEPDQEGLLLSYMEALVAQLPTQAQQALQQMDDPARQVLAARSYLRAGEQLPERWSWTEERIAAHSETREYRQLIKEVERVRTRFEAENPGYRLYANTQVRSLDTQLQRWNRNRRVAQVAQAIQRAVTKELLKSAYPHQPDAAAVNRFAKFLRHWRPPQAAPLAAPGLSLHGQLRAIDFQVMQGDTIVALADVSVAQSVWEEQGWSEKLQRAIEGTRFVGPLRSPHEPWHYEYAAHDEAIRSAKK